MPRTTIDIDSSVLRQLKQRQQQEKKTLGQLVSELLAQALAGPPPEPRPLEWSSQDMRPKVDLEDKDAVMRILDGW